MLYLWDETQRGRGSCEIATCLSLYSQSVTSRSSTVKEITYYSDTCGGQNRNKFVEAGLLHLVAKDESSLNTINHKLFASGHSQMESDTIHSTLENAKRKTSVYVPSQENTFISLARKTNLKPFIVIPMEYTDFKAAVSQIFTEL